MATRGDHVVEDGVEACGDGNTTAGHGCGELHDRGALAGRGRAEAGARDAGPMPMSDCGTTFHASGIDAGADAGTSQPPSDDGATVARAAPDPAAGSCSV